MDLKFKQLLTSYIPKGKAWEDNQDFNKILEGFSNEFGRVHSKIKNFYNNFNIIKSSVYAVDHSKDYFIVQGLYNNLELQRIMVEYLNKNYHFIDALKDFSNFINIPIKFLQMPTPFEIGSSQFGDEFGDPNALSYMNLFISFDQVVDLSCEDYNKVRWLSEYLKPPYLTITYTNQPTNTIEHFEIGLSQFGDEFGGIGTCTIIL